MTRVAITVEGAQAHGAEDVYTDATLYDLLNLVQDAIDEFGYDAVVVTRDAANRYGAMFGRFSAVDGIVATDEEGR